MTTVTLKFTKPLFEPVLAPLMANRVEGLALVGFGAAQVGLTLAGLPAWTCPIHALLGIPCPGCGLTRAMVLLLHGDWRGALAVHAFAPLFLAGLALLAAGTLLPNAPRQRLVQATARVETQSGVTALVLFGLMVYWGLRLFHWI
jgi:hypothetical protein